MAKRIENECVNCGLPCLGSTCPNRNVEYHYCDECGEEQVTLYAFDGEELCGDCILNKLEVVWE